MKRGTSIVLAIAFVFAGIPARADDHVVSREAMEARLREAAAQRQAHIAAVRSALASPVGAYVRSRTGLDAEALAGRVAGLGDQELRDLAERAALLKEDPVASGLTKTLLIIALVVLVFIGLLALQCSSDEGCFY
jgi:hypothetical protein